MRSKISKELAADQIPAEKYVSSAGLGAGRKYAWALAGALLSGLVFTLTDGSGRWLSGWIDYSALAFIGLATTIYLKERLAADNRVEKAALAAYFLRLGLGLCLALMLPIAGYQDNETSQAGYVFQDAYIRDSQAWDLVRYNQPLASAYQEQTTGDQYGGLLALDAFLYRYLSPDAHRQLLLVFLNAMLSAWGVLFLWKGAWDWFGKTAALASAWIFALYPESVLLGSSQMREPFIVAAVAIAFYALTQMAKSKRIWLGWLALAAAILFFIHPPSGLVAIGLLFLVWLLDPRRGASWKKVLLFGSLLFLALIIVVYFWTNLPSIRYATTGNIFLNWLQNNFQYQTHRLERASGIFAQAMSDTQGKYKLIFVLGYGAVQPVLPAAIIEPGAWIWKLIVILRALGWYLLAPLMGYALFASFRARTHNRRLQLILLCLAMWAWVLLAAAAGGGDQWDNVRYRVDFIALEALLAAWGWTWAQSHQDYWLGRLLLIEGVFVLVFTVWYLGRYLFPVIHMSLWTSMGLTVILSTFALAGSWLWEKKRLW